MNEYEKTIEELAKKDDDRKFLNSSDEHALIVLKNIVKKAKGSIRTVCGNMCSELSQDADYLNIVEQYLSSNNKSTFEILFDNYQQEFSNLPIAKVLRNHSKQVKIRKFKSGYSHLYYKGDPIHLTVADNKAFRMETDIKNKMAWGSFNSPDVAQNLSKAIERFFSDEYSEPVSL